MATKTQNQEIIDKIITICQWSFGKDTEVYQYSKKWIIRNRVLDSYEECSSLEKLRNFVCNYTEELIAGNQKWEDEWRLKIDELWDVDFSKNKKSQTEKGITETGIVKAAEKKGFSINRKDSYVYVAYPGSEKQYKYKGSLLEIAHKVGIISKTEANERLNNDGRFA